MSNKDNFSGKLLAGTYRVGQILGKGGMGTVYEAVNERIGKPFAVKVLPPEADVKVAMVKRFKREALIASNLGHPNIVYVVDFNQTKDGIHYIVMEHLEGEDLSELLGRKRSLPVPRAVSIASQVCSALQAAHDKNVIHRDLKPANIFLCSRDEGGDIVKVLDFGISKIIGAADVTTLTKRQNALLGTPHFMAPEQVEGNNDQVGPRSDIFAMGAILYQTLTGEPAFSADSLLGLIYKVANHDPPPPSSIRPHIPPAFDEVIARAMAKDPKERYPSMKELGTSLRQAAGLPAQPWETETEPGDGSTRGSAADDLVSTVIELGDDPTVIRNDAAVDEASAALKAQSTFSTSVAEVMDTRSSTDKELPATTPVWKKVVPAVVLGSLLAGIVLYIVSTGQHKTVPPAPQAPPPKVAVAVPPADSIPRDSGGSAEPRQPVMVSLTVQCKPKEARVQVGDQVRTGSPAVFELPVSEDAVKINISARGYRSRDSTWVPGESEALDFKLERVRPRKPRREIFSKPSFAK